MRLFLPADLHRVTARVVAALGAPPEEAEQVAESLVGSNLAGHDSHGIVRLEQYAKMVQGGGVTPGAPTVTVREAPCTALLDGGWNFGQVVARRAMALAIEKARTYGTGTVSVRNSLHLGRLGEYPLMAVPHGMLAIGMVNNHGRGLLVTPFGGSQGRLATNPLAFACPGPERPVLMDITTSVVAEGKIRMLRNLGKTAPEGWLVDSEGNATGDPGVLYNDPRGALLPLGGAVGHKGYALAVMVDILSGALSGGGCSFSPDARLGNAMFFTVVDIAKFVPLEEFLEQVEILQRWVESCPPAHGVEAILMPGAPEFATEKRRRREGIPVDPETWRQFSEMARGLGVEDPLLEAVS